MAVKIEDIAYHLPERVVSNQDLLNEHPDWDMNHVEQRSGVVKRHVAADEETALDLAVKACERLLASRPQIRGDIDGILFCTQSNDYIMPPNSCVLHRELGLAEDVFALDFNLACSGYIYGLALARGLIGSGIASRILLVTADTYSKYIHAQDRSAGVLFGDGAAATLITSSDSNVGIVDIECSTSGGKCDTFIIPAGGCRMPKTEETAVPLTDDSGNVRTLEKIHMDGLGILKFVNSKVPKQVRHTLSRNELEIDDVDLFVFHQASRMALDSLRKLLKIEPERVFQNYREIGNTVSASIPIALRDAMDQGKLVSGDRVVLSGFGVGLSWGTAIIQM